MSDPRFDDMMKATRLTQAGRVEEATTLLQRLLGVASPLRASSSEGRAANEPPTIDGVAEHIGTVSAKASSGPKSASSRDIGAGASGAIARCLPAPSLTQAIAACISNHPERRTFRCQIFQQRSGKPRVQTLYSKPSQGTSTADRHAARMSPVAGRLCGRNPHELRRRKTWRVSSSIRSKPLQRMRRSAGIGSTSAIRSEAKASRPSSPASRGK